MFKKLLRAVSVALLVTLVVAGGLYLAGLRVVMDGGGGFHLQFVSSPDSHAAEVARHREAQRAAAAAAPAPAATSPAPGTAAASPATTGPDLTSASGPSAQPGAAAAGSPAGSTYWT